MNKAINMSTGDWIIFMNAGDVFYSVDAIEKIMSQYDGSADVIYGNALYLYAHCSFIPDFNREKNKFQKNLKILGMAVLGIVIIEVVPIFQSIKNMVNTSLFFWNDNLLAKTGVGGSDMVLRVRQVFYPLVEVSNNIVFGHGFGWCGWYLGKYELHPILFGFETILST